MKCCELLHMHIPLMFTRETVKWWCEFGCTSPERSSWYPNPQQHDQAHKVQFNNKLGVAVETWKLSTSVYKREYIWFGIDQIQTVQNALPHVDDGHAAELEYGLKEHGLHDRGGFLLASAVSPVF